ncbi:MAG: hypothetical protein AAF942_02830 [Pseudomonadota bacterium]
MTDEPDPQEREDIDWIDISSFSEPSRGMMSYMIRHLGFSLFYLFIGLAAVVYGAYSTTLIGASDQASIVVLSAGAAIVIGGFFYFVHSIDDWVSGATVLGSEISFTKPELARSVPGLDRPLRDILADVTRFAASKGDVSLPDKLKRDRKWIAIYRFLMGFGFIVAYLVHDYVSGFDLGVVGNFLAGGLVLTAGLGFIAFMYKKSASIGRPSVDTVRDYDHRAPVLLLRSFKDDQLRVWRRFNTLPWSFDRALRFEQAIASRLAQVGPVIAVSAPGEEIPQLGAARAQLDDGDWQEQVSAWMAESAITAMIAGPTEWIRWELDQLIEQGGTERLFILIPPMLTATKEHPLEERWQNVLRPFANTQWAEALNVIDPAQTLLVQLDPGGQVGAIRSGGHMMRDYQLAITLGIYRRHCVAGDGR